MDDILTDLGLTVLEIKIYKLLLYDGPNLAGRISRKTGIHRRNVYDALERLIQKGLVSYIKENNKNKYVANDPEIVLDKLKAKEKDWQQLIPELHKYMNNWGEKKETLFFRGINGIKHVFLDQIEIGKEILVHATNADVDAVVKYFFPRYQLLRKENKIPTRMIFDTGYKKNKNIDVINSLPLCKIKFLRHFNTSLTSQYIYGDNIALVVWTHEPFAILIRHKEISQGFRERFELLWKL